MGTEQARGACVLAAVLLCAATGHATPIVNDAQPIDRRVRVQLVQTSNGPGGPQATAFGDATQRALIEQSVDLIWAQAGIDVDFVDAVTPWASSTGYWGGGSATEVATRLRPLIDLARDAGVLSGDPLTLNLILVNRPPLFDDLSLNQAAGVAFAPGNGIAQYVGSNLLTFEAGRDVIASVVAHEIGHNLGLQHVADGTANLLSPGGTSEQLNSQQVSQARGSRFLRTVDTAIAGDFNQDGIVSAADYAAWRDGAAGGGTYAEWAGAFEGAAGLAFADQDEDTVSRFAFAVPEPTGAGLVVLGLVAGATGLRRRD